MVPGDICDPILSLWFWHTLVISHADTSSKEEEILIIVEVWIVHHLKLDCQLEGKEKLMLFEQRLTCVSEHIKDVDLVNGIDLILLGSSDILSISDRLLEEVSVPRKTELIHWVDLVEV